MACVKGLLKKRRRGQSLDVVENVENLWKSECTSCIVQCGKCVVVGVCGVSLGKLLKIDEKMQQKSLV